MARKLGFPQFLSRMRDANYTVTSSSSSYTSASSSAPFPFTWPASCALPRTLSFRSAKEEGYSSTTELPRRSNPPSAAAAGTAAAEEGEEQAAERKSFSSTASEGSDVGDAVEAAIRRLRSVDRRLLFDPDSATSSSIVEAAAAAALPFEGSIAMAVESVDPYGDFRRSMEEMVAAHGGRGGGDRTAAASVDWLEEMLRWYLKANAKKNHGVIVLAFLDLLSTLPPPLPALTSSSPSSPSSSATTFETVEEVKV